MAADAQAVLRQSEKEFSAAVVEYARLCGWRVYRTWRSDHSPAGFPDLTMTRGGKLFFAELKAERGRVSPEQQGWLEALRDVIPHTDYPHRWIRVFLWRPSDWPQIERELR